MSCSNETAIIQGIIKEMSQIRMEYVNIKPSEFDIGMRYLYGYTRKSDDSVIVDIPVDYNEAIKHFNNDIGTGRGYYGFGIMCLNGLGFDKDIGKAKQFFDLAWPLINKNADTNDGSFDRLIAEIYLHGDRGQPKDILKAKAKYTSAAKKGDGPALDELTYNYYFGEEAAPGWKADKDKALYYAKRAVLHPHYNFMSAGYVAGCILDELGKKDESIQYFEQAARLGQDDAQVEMALYFERMNVFELAVPYYRRAYEQDNVFAQFRLGYCYYYGLGIARDKPKGLNMIYDAASKGDVNAKIFLENLH